MKTQGHSQEDKLLELAYGELPAEEARAVESHVQGCTQCTHALESIRGVRRTMAQLPDERPPDDGLESLLAYAEQAARRSASGPQPKNTFWRKWLIPVAGMAGLAVVVGVSLKVDLNPAPVSAPAAELLPAKLEQAQSETARRTPSSAESAPARGAPAAAGPSPLAEASSGEGREERGQERVVKRDLGDLRVQKDADRYAQNTLYDAPTAQRPSPSKRGSLPVETEEEDRQLGGAKLDESGASGGKGSGLAMGVVGSVAEKKISTKNAASGGVFGETLSKEKAGDEVQAAAGPPSMKTQRASPKREDSAQEVVPEPDEAEALSSPSQRGGSAPRRAEAESPPAEAMAKAPSMPKSREPASSIAAEDASSSAVLRDRPASVANPAAKTNDGKRPAQPDVTVLSSGAEEARRRGDRARELALLRQAINQQPSSSVLSNLLSRLCDAELALGAETEGCRALLAQFPGTRDAELAGRRLNAVQPKPATAQPIQKK